MNKTLRVLVLCVAALALGAFVAGCGDDSNKSGAGAPPGASGDAAGGFAPEAGKKRDPKDVAEEKQNFSSEPAPISTLIGDYSGYNVSKPTVTIVRTTKEFNNLKKRHFSNGVKREPIAPVGFNQDRQVVALTLPKSPAGTQVQITDVSQGSGGVIRVRAVELTRGSGCEGGKATRPISWVETRKMQGTPKLELTKQQSSPCT